MVISIKLCVYVWQRGAAPSKARLQLVLVSTVFTIDQRAIIYSGRPDIHTVADSVCMCVLRDTETRRPESVQIATTRGGYTRSKRLNTTEVRRNSARCCLADLLD